MAIKPFNSVAGFSIGETPANIILSNGYITTNGATFTANIAALGVLTDNLYYANGTPWDLSDPGGSNTAIQFNDDESFGGSAAFTFDKDTANLDLTGNITVSTGIITGDGAGISNIAAGNIIGLDLSSISNGTSNVNIATSGGNVTVGVAGNAAIMTVTGTGSNIAGTLNVSGIVTVPSTSGAIDIALGTPTQGNLTSNALTLTTASSVSNSIAQLNQVLGKLVPSSPPAFPASQTLAVDSLSTYRMTDFTQTDNTGTGGKSVAGGTTVTKVRRSSTYTTNAITNAGPGDSGTITLELNGVAAGSRTLTTSLDGNGTYSNLIISNNVDYNAVDSNVAAGFWSVFTADSAGSSIPAGWNEVQITDSAASDTNTPDWYYDSSSPGTPQFSAVTFTADATPTLEYSSTVPHYTNATTWEVDFNVNRLSGDMYPTSDTFATGSSGGAFSSPASRSYAQASITTPLTQNLYVASGSTAVSTTSSIISGFGSSSGGPSVSVTNSYASGTQTFSPSGTVLYKTGTTSSSSRIEEANVYIGSTIGSGSGLASRIANPGSTDNPTFTASATLFDSENGPLQTYDATVADSLAHNVTDYSTGYFPAGPDLSAQGASHYFTFRFIRTSVSKFDVKFSGTIAGLWIALPGSAIDSTSSSNGWLDMSTAYAGSGIPGANIGAGGNGSDGCATGGTVTTGSSVSNESTTATFGTVSSSSTATNEIYVRIKLTSGQSVSALSLESASN